MARLIVTLKNGKQVHSKGCPDMQAFLWRTRLLSGETILLPTDNGTLRTDGRAVSSATVDSDTPLSTEQASACMLVEPHVHYRSTSGDTFQFSRVTHDFERAERRPDGAVYWRVDALPETTWVRAGHDTLALLEPNHR